MGNGIGIGSERSRFARGALLLCVRKLEALMHRLLAVAVAVALVIGSGLLIVGVAVLPVHLRSLAIQIELQTTHFSSLSAPTDTFLMYGWSARNARRAPSRP